MRTPGIICLLIFMACAGCRKSGTSETNAAPQPPPMARRLDAVSTLAFRFSSKGGPVDTTFKVTDNGTLLLYDLKTGRELLKQIPLDEKGDLIQKILALDLSGMEGQPPVDANDGGVMESLSLKTEEKNIDFTASAEAPFPPTVRAALLRLKDEVFPK
jgi:hypothetical protein